MDSHSTLVHLYWLLINNVKHNTKYNIIAGGQGGTETTAQISVPSECQAQTDL